MPERPWEFCRESRKRAELPLLLLKLCRRRSGVSLDSTSLNDRNLLFAEDFQRRPQDFLSRGHSSKAREASKPSGKDRTFEHRKRCKSRQLYLPESLTKKLPQREGYDAGRSAVKAASRHQDNLSVAERARAGEQEELHALVHTTCLFPPCAQVLFFFTLSHLCKMEEESELDRLLELEREVFSEGEGEETWSVIRSAELADTPSKSSSSAAQGSVAPRRVQESSAASKVLQAREYEQALQGCLLRAAKRPKIEMPWESPLMKGIFGEPEPLVLVPSVQIQNTASQEEAHQDPGAVIGNILLSARPPAKASALAAIKNRPNLSFPKSEQTLRLKGIALWCEIIWSDPQKFGITRRIQISDAGKKSGSG